MAKKELKETYTLMIEQYDNGFTIKDPDCNIAEVVEVPQDVKRIHASSEWHKGLGKIIAEDLAAMMDAALSNVAEITYTITVTEEEKE